MFYVSGECPSSAYAAYATAQGQLLVHGGLVLTNNTWTCCSTTLTSISLGMDGLAALIAWPHHAETDSQNNSVSCTVLDTEGTAPSMRYGHAAASYHEVVYIFGGADRSAIYHDLFSLTFTEGTWFWSKVDTQGSSLLPRVGHSFHAFPGVGLFVVYGGVNSDTFGVPSTNVMAITTDTHTVSYPSVNGPAPAGVYLAATTAIFEQTDSPWLFIAGGLSSPDSISADIFVLNGIGSADPVDHTILIAVSSTCAACILICTVIVCVRRNKQRQRARYTDFRQQAVDWDDEAPEDTQESKL